MIISPPKIALFLIASSAVFIRANAQESMQTKPPTEPADQMSAQVCKPMPDWLNTDFFGPWTVLLEGAGAPLATTLHMQRNPLYEQSLAGSYRMGAQIHEVFGDMEDGTLELEESANGKDIIAIWTGQVVAGSCGKTILGTRRSTQSAGVQNFILRRPGW
jgi:hypothetical protein